MQLAYQAGLHVFATASTADASDIQNLGAITAVDYKRTRFEKVVPSVDIVLDTVGGNIQERSRGIIKPGGILVSVVSEPTPDPRNGIRGAFFLVEVTTDRVNKIAELFNQGKLIARVGTVLPLDEVRTAHEMLAGVPHQPGKIILRVGAK